MIFGMWKHLYGIVSILFTFSVLKRMDSTLLFLGSTCLKVFSLLAFHRMQMGVGRPGGRRLHYFWATDAVAREPSPEDTQRDSGRRAGPVRERPGPSGLTGGVSGGLADGPSLGLKRGLVGPDPSLPQAPGWIRRPMLQTGSSSSRWVFVAWGPPASKSPSGLFPVCPQRRHSALRASRAAGGPGARPCPAAGGRQRALCAAQPVGASAPAHRPGAAPSRGVVSCHFGDS